MKALLHNKNKTGQSLEGNAAADERSISSSGKLRMAKCIRD